MMKSSRAALLGAFGVGCLSTAVLLGFWHTDDRADAAQNARGRSVELVTAPLVPAHVEEKAEHVDASARTVARAEPAHVESADRADDVKDSPAAPKDAPDVANAPQAGSAVSDVLTDLEAAYRQRLIAAARAEAAARTDAEPKPERAATPPAPVAPPSEPPREVAAQAVAVTPAPAALAPAAPPPVEPPSVVVEVPPTATIIAQNDARPVDVHVGDVNQNTYITNVRQGDVYVIQQQLAMLSYMQLAGATNPALTHAHAGGLHQSSQNQFRQFPSTLTNLDNPWGFNFAPPNLVH